LSAPAQRTAPRFKASERGMSLIEVSVAVAIWAVMGTLVAGIMFSTITAQQRVLDLQARYHGGSVALDRLRKELTMAFVSLHQADDKRTRTVFLGESNRILFDTAGNEPLTRNSRQSDQLEVEYRIDTVRNAKGQRVKALVRKVKFHIDDRPGSGGREEILVEGVKDLEFTYFDKFRERWTNDWDVEIDDAPEMRERLKEVQRLRDAVDEARDASSTETPSLGSLVNDAATVAAAGEADKVVDEAQAELMDGLFLPSRVRVRLVLEDPEDETAEHVMETQVEVTMIEPHWY
jgi:prepilin-type N-terminal cleavage/methylation domain-containing protein